MKRAESGPESRQEFWSIVLLWKVGFNNEKKENNTRQPQGDAWTKNYAE